MGMPVDDTCPNCHQPVTGGQKSAYDLRDGVMRRWHLECYLGYAAKIEAAKIEDEKRREPEGG